MTRSAIPNLRGRGRRTHARGFTLVELLVVILIIAALMSILLVGLGRALDRAGNAGTQSQLQALSQGIQAFHNEFQYDPPLITGMERSRIEGIVTPELRSNNAQVLTEYAEARFFSEYSLPAYLLGLGDLNGDGTLVYAESGVNPPAPNLDDGQDDTGIRNPGEFRAWKRREGIELSHSPVATGRVYGPYIDPGTMRDAIEQVRVNTDLEPVETGGYVLYRFKDRWGSPIRYYRNWPTKNRAPYDGSGTSDPSVAYTPVEIRNPEAVRDQIERGYTATSREVLEAEKTVLGSRFMVVSAGAKQDDPDRDGQFFSPFGDVVLRADGTRQAIGIENPFDPSSLDTIGKELLQKFIKSNIRIAG